MGVWSSLFPGDEGALADLFWSNQKSAQGKTLYRQTYSGTLQDDVLMLRPLSLAYNPYQSLISLYDGNDSVLLVGTASGSIFELGVGDDFLVVRDGLRFTRVQGGQGGDSIWINRSLWDREGAFHSVIDTEDGDDYVLIDKDVRLVVDRAGILDAAILMGNGSDRLVIRGDGNVMKSQYDALDFSDGLRLVDGLIDLGPGNDFMLIKAGTVGGVSPHISGVDVELGSGDDVVVLVDLDFGTSTDSRLDGGQGQDAVVLPKGLQAPPEWLVNFERFFYADDSDFDVKRFMSSTSTDVFADVAVPSAGSAGTVPGFGDVPVASAATGTTSVIDSGSSGTVAVPSGASGGSTVVPSVDETSGSTLAKIFKLDHSVKRRDIVSYWFNSVPPQNPVSEDVGDGYYLDVVARTWTERVKIKSVAQAPVRGGRVDATPIDSGHGYQGSVLNGDAGNDILWGRAGWDVIDGGDGDDLVRAGNGRDIITGGNGRDELHGDFGWNTFTSSIDGYSDLIVIKSDQYLVNPLFGRADNNNDGSKCDVIEGLDAFDKIKIIGVKSADLSFRANVTTKGVTGIGIYAKGALEALYIGGDLTIAQITQMTAADLAPPVGGSYGGW